MVGLLNKVPKHGLGNFEVRNDAVLHGPNRDDVSGSSTEHILGFFADSQNSLAAAGKSLNCDHRWLIGYDPTPFHEGKGGRRAKINGEIVRKETVYPIEKHMIRTVKMGYLFPCH